MSLKHLATCALPRFFVKCHVNRIFPTYAVLLLEGRRFKRWDLYDTTELVKCVKHLVHTCRTQWPLDVNSLDESVFLNEEAPIEFPDTLVAGVIYRKKNYLLGATQRIMEIDDLAHFQHEECDEVLLREKSWIDASIIIVKIKGPEAAAIAKGIEPYRKLPQWHSIPREVTSMIEAVYYRPVCALQPFSVNTAVMTAPDMNSLFRENIKPFIEQIKKGLKILKDRIRLTPRLISCVAHSSGYTDRQERVIVSATSPKSLIKAFKRYAHATIDSCEHAVVALSVDDVILLSLVIFK